MKKKPGSIIVNHDPESIRGYIRYLKSEKRDFSVIKTGYTLQIVRPDGAKYFYSDKRVNNALFSIVNRIKKDIDNSGMEVPALRPHNIDYYGISAYFERHPAHDCPEDMVCIDLNSAYAQSLLNAFLISRDTFAALQALPKADRLRAVGMLATRKVILQYEAGKLKKAELKSDEHYRNCFLYACDITAKAMQMIATDYPDEFMFYWVDGIYLKNTNIVNEIAAKLFSNGFPAKIEYLHAVRASKNPDFLHFSYIKTDSETEKTLVIPTDREFRRQEINKYLNDEQKENELERISEKERAEID